MERTQGKELLLVGPTNSGFTDPAQLTGLSMLQITSALLSQQPVLDRIVLGFVLRRMQDELPETFWAVEPKLQKEEATLSSQKADKR
ncbi:MAG: hypothetical protein HY661_11170 [Betaproteobacteria bacterium]|nr:hypothetical protein [Betaproteobacteria bacterium]